MADKTAISWCDSTWNPVRGCTKVSAGCKNCYAERFAERWRGVKGHPFEQGFDVRLVPEKLDLPLHWKRPRKIFVNSMSDLFHPEVPDGFIGKVFGCIAEAYWHTFLILTKRPERMRDYSNGLCHYPKGDRSLRPVPGWPPNAWLGVTAENQETADERTSILLDTPAAHRFVSYEPALGPVDAERYLLSCKDCGNRGSTAFDSTPGRTPCLCTNACIKRGEGPSLDWVIVGGESGPGARPCDMEWIRSIVSQCKSADVPCFVKQLGANYCDAENGIGGRSTKQPDNIPPIRRLVDRAGSDPSEWPEDLRVQQFPEEMTCRK